MALPNFFVINMPYTLKRVNENLWISLNRGYSPIGVNQSHTLENMSENVLYCTEYKGLTNNILKKIATPNDPNAIQYDDTGKICQIWLYSDATVPFNSSGFDNKLFKEYCKRLALLAKLPNTEYSNIFNI